MVNTQTLIFFWRQLSQGLCQFLGVPRGRRRQRQMIEIGQVVLKGPKSFTKQ